MPTISTPGDLASRLDSALAAIEAGIAARAAAQAKAKQRHENLKLAASEAVAALDALVGDA